MMFRIFYIGCLIILTNVTWTLAEERFLEIPDGPSVKLEDGTYSVVKSNGEFTQPVKADYSLQLRAGIEIPEPGQSLKVPEAFSKSLTTDQDVEELFLVQFFTPPMPAYRKALEKIGFKIYDYVPNYTYLVKGRTSALPSIESLDYVRWIGPYHPSYKLDQTFQLQLESKSLTDSPQPYNIYSISADDAVITRDSIISIGGIVLKKGKSRLITADLTAEQVMKLLREPTVQWIEGWHRPEEDMDNARIQGGADFLKLQASIPDGYTGIGIHGHIMEGINASHPDFAANSHRSVPIAVDDPAPASHGHATFGIVFGSGEGDARARGMMPNGQGLYTNYRAITATPGSGGTGAGTRYELVERLINDQQILFQTASWGNGRTDQYTTISAEMDQLIFDLDLPITQSQSNAGTTQSRPQAWAKNIISVGAIQHYDNSLPADDSWQAGNASIGFASDGRIKPDVCAYYDSTWTTDLSGYRQFGGTSGATPIVAGHLGLILEMWSTGAFGNSMRIPGGSIFENRPHFTTAKALLIISAKQYDFDTASIDNRREHQGWGVPDLKRLFELRDRVYIVDETDVLKPFEETIHKISVLQGEPLLKVCMTYADPPGNPGSTKQLVNDLDLRVVAPNNTEYRGNWGLKNGTASVNGGTADKIDTVECVIVKNPPDGEWQIEVSATSLVADGHIETVEIDSDYALVVLGGRSIEQLPPQIIRVSTH